jgi:hypothetical protein
LVNSAGWFSTIPALSLPIQFSNHLPFGLLEAGNGQRAPTLVEKTGKWFLPVQLQLEASSKDRVPSIRQLSRSAVIARPCKELPLGLARQVLVQRPIRLLFAPRDADGFPINQSIE